MNRHVCLLLAALAIPSVPAAQIPEKFENLQVLPRDIPRPQLVQRMREFSLALDVRCEYCHVGGDPVTLEGMMFSSDERPAKAKARAMMRMVDQLNNTFLPALPARAEPRIQIECATCHRGLALPKTLQTTLFEVIAKDGAAAGVARYRELRSQPMTLGRYNFGEREISGLARRLIEAGKVDAAIAMLEVNGEFNPKSAEIDFQIGELHRTRGDRDQAIARYKAALAKASDHAGAKRRLAELEGKSPP
jgi:hypothetical protein